MIMGTIGAIALGWATAVMGYGERIAALESNTESMDSSIERLELKIDRVLELVTLLEIDKRRRGK
jgi:hypothetical protein